MCELVLRTFISILLQPSQPSSVSLEELNGEIYTMVMEVGSNPGKRKGHCLLVSAVDGILADGETGK